MKQTLLTLIAFAAIAPAYAQSTTTAAPAGATAPSETTLSAPFRLKAPTFGPMRLKLGIKSQNTSARLVEYDDENGRRFKQKHEYYAGAVHQSGWGGFAQAVTSGSNFDGKNSSKSTLSAGDPSLTLMHPDLYKDDNLTVNGQFRRYFPVSDRSVNRNQRQYAYYSFANLKMAKGLSLFNQAIPRYFDQDFYKVGDTDYYFEDLTVLAKSLNDWFSYGVSQWSQVEWHRGTPTGTSVDATLFGRFSFIGGILIEPRLILPVSVRNSVYDASPDVGLNNMKAELFAQMSI